MNNLKDKEFGGGINERLFYYKDVKEAVLEFNMFIKTLKNENSVNGLTNKDRDIICLIMDKYEIKPVEKSLNTYDHILYIHKEIFGDWEK